jgi:nucleoside-diphosphate-sugar epimerase
MAKLNAITGAAGLLGSYLVERLAAEGERIRAFVLPINDTSLLEELGAEVVVGDLADLPAVEEFVRGADIVYHCAAKTGNWDSWSDHLAGTVETTRNVVQACRQSAQTNRLLHVSSISVYGHPRPRGEDIKEDAALGQHPWLWDHYNRAKIEAERIVGELGDRATIIRPTWMYGPRDLAIIPALFKAVRSGGAWVIGSGDNLLNMVHVADVADAAVRAANHPQAGGEAYNVCTAGELTQRQLLDLISAAVGQPPVRRRIPYRVLHLAGLACEVVGRLLRRKRAPLVTRHGISVFMRPPCFSYAKARCQLGWEPKPDTRERLASTLRWLETHGED